MKFEDGRQSSNIEDRRGQRARGGRGVKIGGGIGTIVIALVAIYMGIDPSVVLQNTPASSQAPTASKPRPADEDRMAKFVGQVLKDTEDTWHVLFREAGKNYKEPKLVLFTDAVKSACGFQNAAVGPFYCPGDNKVYIDLSFFHELGQRYKAPGDFAQAYVVAHEIGHHVQNLMGTSDMVHQKKRRMRKIDANKMSVQLELQADCYAGIWAHHADKTRHVLEAGDIEEGLKAAAAIGDDRLQKQSKGYISPESFTHGTSAQRQKWFMQGYKTGTIQSCDTFAAQGL